LLFDQAASAVFRQFFNPLSDLADYGLADYGLADYGLADYGLAELANT
jgi:hypothetical protein